MERISVKSKTSPNFIGAWDLPDKNLCKKIIEFFENNKELQRKGSTSTGVNEKIKKTTDITIDPILLNEKKYLIFNEYFEQLNECFKDYNNQFPFLKTFLKKIHIGHFNLQKYLPGDHFSKLHSERTDLANLHRIFAWMTYLNDVEDGGTTDFDYFNLKIKPECGKTLIWPSEWTHAHTGSVLKSGEKYIITGWMHFAD